MRQNHNATKRSGNNSISNFSIESAPLSILKKLNVSAIDTNVGDSLDEIGFEIRIQIY